MSKEPDKTATENKIALGVFEETKTASPVTTAEEDRHTAGQRRVNLTWEYTQSFIAVVVTLATLFTSVVLIIAVARGDSSVATSAAQTTAALAAFNLLSNAFFLVIGFYFGRTNHTNVGGVKHPAEGR